MIFKLRVPGVRETNINITSFFHEKGLVKHKDSSRHISLKDTWLKFLVGFFDGAIANTICGTGMLIYISLDECYKFKWCNGHGFNTRVELLA